MQEPVNPVMEDLWNIPLQTLFVVMAKELTPAACSGNALQKTPSEP